MTHENATQRRTATGCFISSERKPQITHERKPNYLSLSLSPFGFSSTSPFLFLSEYFFQVVAGVAAVFRALGFHPPPELFKGAGVDGETEELPEVAPPVATLSTSTLGIVS